MSPLAFLVPPKPAWRVNVKGVSQHRSLKSASEKKANVLVVPTTHQVAHELALVDADGIRDRVLTLTCPWYVIDALEDKERLFYYAKQLRLISSLPRHYASASECRFPCIVKPSDGVFSAGVTVVHSASELRAWVKRHSPKTRWIFQEYVPGNKEYSTLLVVVRGKFKAAMRSEYTYDGHMYVSPYAQEIDYRFSRRLPNAEASVFARFLRDYTGICNVNYKLVGRGVPKILEFNMRLGADCADVPPDELHRFLSIARREAMRLRDRRLKQSSTRSSQSPTERTRVKHLYQSLRDLHDACEASKVHYWMSGETLWGAVMCHGLVPGRGSDAVVEISISERDISKLLRIRWLSTYGYTVVRDGKDVTVRRGDDLVARIVVTTAPSRVGDERIRYPFGNFRAWGWRKYASQLRARYGTDWKKAFIVPKGGLPAYPIHTSRSRAS